MSTHEPFNNLLSQVSQAADLCFKPWKHAVILIEKSSKEEINNNFFDLLLLLECRDSQGERYPENDLEIELFRSGNELNITLAWHKFPDKPILWQGIHSLWMDSVTGNRSSTPENGEMIEAFARKLRARFSLDTDIE
tara:strand:+ start:6835 stop:7245 length:411 start_codon:yes stop_codon:yes gene_type:complete